MARLSYFLAHLCQNVRVRIAAPRRVERGVGWADVHVFFDKDKPKFLQDVWKNQLQTFPYKMFFYFYFSFLIGCCLHWITDQLFFCLISDKEGGLEDGCKNGVPQMGWGDTPRPPRSPPSAVSTSHEKMEKN